MKIPLRLLALFDEQRQRVREEFRQFPNLVADVNQLLILDHFQVTGILQAERSPAAFAEVIAAIAAVRIYHQEKQRGRRAA